MPGSFSFSQHCSSSGCGAVPHLSLSRAPSPSPLRAPLFSCLQQHRFAVRKQRGLGVSVDTAQTQPPGTCPSHALTPCHGMHSAFQVSLPLPAPLRPSGDRGGHKPWPKQSPTQTPGQGQLLLLLFPTSSKVSVMFSSCDLRKSPPCCLNQSVGWLCRASSPRTEQKICRTDRKHERTGQKPSPSCSTKMKSSVWVSPKELRDCCQPC